MIKIIKSEFQKSRRTSINKFVIITPIFTILLSKLWGGGQNGAYNWWYVMFLPGMLAIISAQVITKEENLDYKGLFLYPQDKGNIWLGKLIYISILFLISSLVFMFGIMIIGSGSIYKSSISLKANILATIILFLTLLFQIPLSLFLTTKLNMFFSILVNIVMTVFGVASFGTNSFLKFNPYGIPSASMVPVLNILPNGLPASRDSLLLNGSISLNIVINISVFLILTVATTIWFRNKEVN